MREIKFRAWIEESKTMEVGLFGLRSDGKASFNKDSVLLQFTGLKDKNGVDIYEGDVVIPFTDQKTKAQIIFMSGGFKIATKTKEDNYHIWNYFQSEIEVIGNIYENPELLNK